MARMQDRSIIAIGDAGHGEFRDVEQWLRDRGVLFHETCADALSSPVAASQSIFLLAAHRGAFSQASVELLHCAAPLARLIAVCGSWCEGETRSGNALAGVARVYWHQFMPRASASLDRVGDYAGWGLPRTATAIDASLHASQRTQKLSQASIGIVAQTRGDYLALAEAVSACGLVAERVTPGKDISQMQAVLWDGHCLDTSGEARLKTLVETISPCPVIVLLHFPRAQEVTVASSCGAAGVLGKPFLVGDLSTVLATTCGLQMPVTTRQAG